MSQNRFHRQINDLVHIINGSNGTLLSFDADDGLAIINHPEEIDASDSKDLQSLMENYGRLSGRSARPVLIDLGQDFCFPTICNIELLRRCSEHCVHCYVGDQNLQSADLSYLEKLSNQELETLVKDLKKLGVFLVVITGGEPFCSTRLRLFIEMLTEHGFLIEIFSNLQKLPDWFIKNIERYSICRIQTSVYGSNSLIHDVITKCRGSFERTMQSVKRLTNANIYLEVATPIMKMNFEDLPAIRDYIESLGLKHNYSWPIVNEYYTEHTGKPKFNISPAQFAEFVQQNPDFLIRNNFDPDKPICAAGCAVMSISAEGQIFPCSQFPLEIGYLANGDSVHEIYYSRKMEKIRQLRANYSTEEICNFCPGINYTETDNPLQQPRYIVESIMAAKKGGDSI